MIYINRQGPPVFERIGIRIIGATLAAAFAVLASAYVLGVLVWALFR